MENVATLTMIPAQVQLNPVVIFELDKTLLKTALDHLWIEMLVMHGLVDEKLLDLVDDFSRITLAGRSDFYDYQRELLKPLHFFSKSFLLELRSEFLDLIPSVLSKKAHARLAQHRNLGHQALLITTCIDFLAEPVGRMLGFDHILCTHAEQINGVFTGNIIGLPAFREGKVDLLYRWANEYGMDLKGSWGYSDSIHDIALLKAVDNPVAVSPDPMLRKYARQNGWQILPTN